MDSGEGLRPRGAGTSAVPRGPSFANKLWVKAIRRPTGYCDSYNDGEDEQSPQHDAMSRCRVEELSHVYHPLSLSVEKVSKKYEHQNNRG